MNVGNSEIMIDLVQYMRKTAGAQAALQERKRKVALQGNAHEGFLKDSKFTAGGIFKSGQVHLGENVLAARREMEAKKMEGSLNPIRKSIDAFHSRMQKYEKLELDRQKPYSKPITVNQLAIWFSVRKTKADKIPKRKDLQIALMEEWAGRPILTLKQYLLDQGKDEMYVNMVFAERASIAAEAEAVVEEGSDGDGLLADRRLDMTAVAIANDSENSMMVEL
ncbi:unnamed protein product [Cylindrotheca closterium]|uniref:Uncharacterized protein n=1 Tax=Cylindrotheca closterium TaxID=2856 RepID=A0AAD2G545_9STRA|nr:unnamed protein product [Cylindrotheca closterium]